jgi:hypothetical protein
MRERKVRKRSLRELLSPDKRKKSSANRMLSGGMVVSG